MSIALHFVLRRTTCRCCRLFLVLAVFGCSLNIDEGRAEEKTVDGFLERLDDGKSKSTNELCDDATFLRRLTLDLVGRVPTEAELDSFLLDGDRAAVVDRFLNSEQHPRFWSHLWTAMLVGRGEQRYVEKELLRQWVETELRQQSPLNQVCYELISATGVSSLHGPASYVVANREDQVMRLSRVFLGVRLDCAQCHDHPYARWTNDEYKAMQRFFTPLRYRDVSGGVDVSDTPIQHKTDKPVFLTGRTPHTTAWRQELAAMVVQSKPFSRAMVDRTWHWLMGHRLKEPDDGNRPTLAKPFRVLLDQLAAEFRESGCQLRPLIRRICLSRAYQCQTNANQTDPSISSTARTARPMLPEQWINSVAVVLGEPMPDPEVLTNRVRQMLSLTRQQGPFQSDPFAWDLTSQTLIRQLSVPVQTHRGNVVRMFRQTLAREPSSDELQLVSRDKPGDVMYALVQSNEFILND